MAFRDTYDDFIARINTTISNHERLIQELRDFPTKRRELQKHSYRDITDYCLETMMLTKEIMFADVNEETIKRHIADSDKMVRDAEEDFYKGNDEDE